VELRADYGLCHTILRNSVFADLFSLSKFECLQSYVGHGDSINEIKTQSLKPSLIVSASKVSPLVTWNFRLILLNLLLVLRQARIVGCFCCI